MTPYQQALRDPRWQRRRLEILQRDRWQCVRCGTTTKELQVHHRWYQTGSAPWESPDTALVTLCTDCHREVSMMPNVPMLVKRQAFTGSYGPIPSAISAEKRPYIAREPLVKQVALSQHLNPDSLWGDYLVVKGGEAFKQAIIKSLSGQGALDIRYLVEFDEPGGLHWLLGRFALHFVAQYDVALEQTIYQHFEETALVVSEGQPKAPSAPLTHRDTSAQGVTLEIAQAQNQQIATTINELIRVRDQQDQIRHVVTQHAQDISDLKRRLPHAGRLAMAAFNEQYLNSRLTQAEVKHHGYTLSTMLRKRNPDWDPMRIRDVRWGEVNTYAIADLEAYFRRLGLL